jgi:cobaltochelatase CobT subunit
MFKYQVFTTDYDLDISAEEYLAILNGAKDPATGAEPALEKWSQDLEQKLQDYRSDIEVDMVPSGDPVTIVLDMSGSMRGVSVLASVLAIEKIGDMLEQAGRPFSVLGYTTRQWKGGQSREAWVKAGKPANPGRLNDRLHITFKGFDDDWSDKRKYLKVPLIEGALKENLDGEAMQWALERQIADAGRGHIFHIGDGYPSDQSTDATNPIQYLKHHLRQVQENIAAKEVTYSAVSTYELIDRIGKKTTAYVTPLTEGIVSKFCEAVAPAVEPEGKPQPF